MKLVLIVVLLLSSSYCLPVSLKKNPWLLGHRGNSIDYPENTIIAFQNCVSLGADGNELDVHLTKDNEIIVIHDSTVDRTTNATGRVSDFTLAEIKDLDAGFWYTNDNGKSYPFRGKGLTVPTIKELCQLVPGIFNIDLKAHTEEAAKKLAEELNSVDGCGERTFVGSFEEKTVEYFKKYNTKNIKTFGSTFEVVEFTLKFYAGNSNEHKPRSQLLNVPVGYVLDQQGYIEASNQVGMLMMFWTINSQRQMEKLLLDGADGIITDEVPLAMKVFRDLGYKP